MQRIALVGEGDAATRRVIATALELHGYRVALAVDGTDCFDILGKGLRPDLLILDLETPAMDALEVLEKLVGTWLVQSLPILAVSGPTRPQAVERAMELGAADHIAKPLHAANFAKRVADFAFEVNEAALRKSLLNLRVKDDTLFAQPGLKAWAGRGHDAYLATHGGIRVCLLIPSALGPMRVARESLGDLAANMHLFRESATGWIRVWPTPSLLG